jgi:transcriptional regulator with XRE-family HTH domain
MPGKKTTPQKLFGEVVRAERRRQGFTQEELAARSGISVVFLSDIERGVENASIGTVAKLARGLETSIGELLLQAGF